jgi:Uma2 family endonuclease
MMDKREASMATNIQQRTTYIPAPAIPDQPIWRIRVEQYHQMTESGILTDDDPVELLEGWLVTKMPKNPPHRLSTQLLREAIADMLPSTWHVNDQEPITTKDSEPEPDISVVKGERRQYLARHPMPHELALVVEVADTTLERDQGSKQRLYARADIHTYWILNLNERQLEVYSEPVTSAEEPAYRQQCIYHEEESVPLEINGTLVGEIRISEILP